MKTQLTDLIVQRLNDAKEDVKKEFCREYPIKVARHFTLDNLLPTEIAEKIYANFPNPRKMHLLSSAGKIKLKYCHLKDASHLLRDINAAIQDPRVVAVVEEITGIKQLIPDTSRFSGGISTLLKGYYLNPHLDNSHNVENKRQYKALNVLYYVSPNWRQENGGNYELWDDTVENHILVPSFFNRLLVMETNRTSWHAVNPVLCDAPRCCIFNYFFSEQSPEGEDYFFSAPSFRARPEQKIRRTIERITHAFKIKRRQIGTSLKKRL